ncbi:MAG: indolepyruvate ferredoxin oxidoreductase [Rhodobacter sp. CACIA14H1]|nr:MAG: indolepyruvate ferredoxin oxidoreductase [Rhodobacter sp. CACIA14H1]
MRIAALPRRRRRLNLTPMIDVVLLLLVFFMMVSRFGGMQGMPLAVAGSGGGAWSGPPRLVSLGADGVALNGVAVPVEGLVAALRPLMASAEDPVVLRTGDAAVQALVAVLDGLRAGGITRVIVVE